MIAAVNGYCLGYGLTLVTWCDFVIASERAEFGFPETLLGTPAIVGAIRLPQKVNWQYAMELLMTGERIDADARQGDRPGRVGGPARVAHGRGPCPRGATPKGAPLAARAMKEVATRSQHLTSVEAIRFGETMRKVAAATEDAVEGGRAAAEGRPPDWRAH